MPDEQEVVQIKPFGAWLQDQRNGLLHSELSEALAEVSSSVLEHNKPGKIVLTVTVKPAATAEHTVFVADDVKTTVPQPDKPTSMFFADDEGNLSRRNPRQPELPLRDVSAPDTSQPPREARGAAQ